MRISFAEVPLTSTGSGSKERIRAWDYLIVAALCFAPMTGWRIGKIGPGEALCFLWGVRYAYRLIFKKNEVISFFALFMTAILMGSFVGSIVARNELRTSGIFTWLYLGVISVTMAEGLSRNSVEYNQKLFYVIACVSVLWQLFLYFYSQRISMSFLGAPIWYRGIRFAGGGTNPHQVAVLLCGLLFEFVRRIFRRQNIIVNAVLGGICFFLLNLTDSSTAIMSIVLAALIFIYLWIGHSVRRKIPVMMIFTLFIVVAGILLYNKIYAFVDAWIKDDANGQGRLIIFSYFGQCFEKSPIFGLGPGVHGRDAVIEFHNTYLEVVAMTGVIGALIFLVYTVKWAKKILAADWSYLPIMVVFYAYGLSGFAMRRLSYWGVLVFVFAIADGILKRREYDIPGRMRPLRE